MSISVTKKQENFSPLKWAALGAATGCVVRDLHPITDAEKKYFEYDKFLLDRKKSVRETVDEEIKILRNTVKLPNLGYDTYEKFVYPPKSLDGRAVASYKARHYLSVLRILLFTEKHQRAVYHSAVLHAVTSDAKIKIVVRVVNIRKLVSDQSFIRYYGRAGAYLADYRDHFPNDRASTQHRAVTFAVIYIEKNVQAYAKIVSYKLELIRFRL